MNIGLLYVELFLPGCNSLKEKRMIVKSLKDRVKNKFNVSIAEVEYQDKWQRAGIAVVTVSESRKYTDETLNKVFRFFDEGFGFELIKHEFEYR